jgi:DNA invertase Pin-like site-specific DNA recombinase
MLIGYARVSTEDQRLELQIDNLVKAGVDPADIYTDKASAASNKRIGLKECLRRLEKNDILVIWKFDRLARSLYQLIEIAMSLEKREVGLRSLTEQIDTTTPGGRMIFHVMGAMGQFERDLIIERTKAGMAAAKARGVQVGRKRLATMEKIEEVRQLLRSGMTVQEAGKVVGLKPSTIYLHLPGGAAALRAEDELEALDEDSNNSRHDDDAY